MRWCVAIFSLLLGLGVVLDIGVERAVAADSDSNTAASDDGNLVGTVAALLADKDKDVRALGLQQVRDAAKGAKATQQFAALLPKLPPEAQTGLLDALADRGDKTARPEVLELLKSGNPGVRDAAIRAIGSLGEPADIPKLIELLQAHGETERTAARASVAHLPGQAVDAAIVAELPRSTAKIQVELIEILATRRAISTVPQLIIVAEGSNPAVRKAAMAALGELAGPGDVAGMLRGVLKAKPGAEREAAEVAVMLVCNRIDAPSKRAEPVLAAWDKFSPDQQTKLLPTLGRVGTPDAMKIVEAAIASSDAAQSESGIRAICNWPDATVAPRLQALYQSASEPKRQELLLRALTRVAVLHDARSDSERLDLLKACMGMASNDDERNYVIKRASAVRTVESLRFLLPYLDQPALAQETCASITELAHHRDLRIPHEAEFNKALDAVIGICKDPVVLDHAQRYRQNKT